MNMIESRMEQRGQGGFTLIELLVVVAILAVLGGAAIIGIGAMRSSAETEVCATNLETLEVAYEAYELTEGAPPADIAAMVTDGYLKEVPGTGTYSISGGAVQQDSCP